MTKTTPFSLPAPAQAHAVVVGGGIMGADVALVLARAGCHTVVVEPGEARRAALPAHLAQGLQQQGAERWSDRVRCVPTLADLSAEAWQGIDLVIECIPEKLPLKQALFAELVQRWPRPDAVLTSNSSQLSDQCHRRGPGHAANACWACTSSCRRTWCRWSRWCGAPTPTPAAAEALAAFMRRCGSVPVQVRKDLPGFLANRLQHALAREAFAMIDAGVATRRGRGRGGALRLRLSLPGGRPGAAARPRRHRHPLRRGRHHVPLAGGQHRAGQGLGDRVARGELGMKTGQGFSPWPPEAIAAERTRYDGLLRAGLQLLAAELPPIDPGE